MVKNVSGGNKTKKQKRNFGRFDPRDKVEPGEMFAQIVHNNGGSFDVLCSDGVSRKGRLCSEMKKGPRLQDGSFVVITLREFESEQKNCDIIGYGDPPHNIVELIKKNNQTSGGDSKKNDVDYADSDDEFKEFEESSKTIKITNSNTNPNTKTNKDNDNGDNYNWDDI
jgi:translation initiation factor IF-1